MRLLVLGGAGQVGQELQALPVPSDVEVVAPNRNALDLADPQAIANAFATAPWDAVINAAAYTEVDRAEQEEDAAFVINAQAPSLLAQETGRRDIPLVHISTDYVFDGTKGAPYVENDVPAPLNVYGMSKLAGERGVMAANARHFILRTSWVYSPYRTNFVRTILRLAAERDRLTIVADQRGCPTAAVDVARACLNIAIRCAAAPKCAPYGLFHFAGLGETTWFEFASTIVDIAAARLGRNPPVLPIRTVDFPTAAARASDTRLDCTAVGRTLGIKSRPWRLALTETLDRML